MDVDSSIQNENLLSASSLPELEGNLETSYVSSQDTMSLDTYPFLLPHEDISMARKGFAHCTICRAKVKWRRINAVQEHLINSKHTQVRAVVQIRKYPEIGIRIRIWDAKVRIRPDRDIFVTIEKNIVYKRLVPGKSIVQIKY
jgi:hypothetical protein